MRAWRFSSVTSSGRPAKRDASVAVAAAKSGSIGTISNRMPSASASARASVIEPSDE